MVNLNGINKEYAVPENFLKIKQMIIDKSAEFSMRQKRIADYIIENPHNFALKSVQELEKELKISKSTIVRLAQELGYSGILALKKDIRGYVSNSFEPLERYENLLSNDNETDNYIDLLNDEVIINLHKNRDLIDYDQFLRFTELIETAKEVHTLGAGVSYFLAEIAAYLLNRVSIKSFPFNRGGAPFPEQVLNFNEEDLILAFYFPAYTKEIYETVKFAKSKGIKVIVITDTATNNIVGQCDAYLQVAVESCTISNSLSSIITVLYAIIAKIGQYKKAETLKALKVVKELRKDS